jgi:hypothetical protein
MNVPSTSDLWLRRLLLGAALSGTLARFLSCIIFNPMQHLYSDMGRHWKNGVQFLDPWRFGGIDPIFYQIYLFVVRCFTAENHLLIGAVTGGLSAVMPWFYYRAAREFSIPKEYSLLLWALIAWIPSLFTIYSFFLNETLLITLMGLALWTTGRSIRKRTVGAFLVAVLVWTLAILTKRTCLPVAIILLAYAWWVGPRQLRTVLYAGLLIFALIAPNAFRSRSLIGFPAPLGSGVIAALQHKSWATRIQITWDQVNLEFGSPSSYIAPLAPLSDWRTKPGREDSTFAIDVSRANGFRDWKAASDSIPADPSSWFRRWHENILLFLFAPSWPESNDTFWIGRINLWQKWLWAPLIAAVLAGNLVLALRGRFHVVAIATTVLALLLLFQNEYPMEGRYRKPLEPFLLFNIVWLLSSPKSTRSLMLQNCHIIFKQFS